MISSNQLRQKYFDYFKDKDHIIVPSSPLLPENDPTTLFTGSGMQPMITYLLEAKPPSGTRLVDSQKCFRAEDIEKSFKEELQEIVNQKISEDLPAIRSVIAREEAEKLGAGHEFNATYPDTEDQGGGWMIARRETSFLTTTCITTEVKKEMLKNRFMLTRLLTGKIFA